MHRSDRLDRRRTSSLRQTSSTLSDDLENVSFLEENLYRGSSAESKKTQAPSAFTSILNTLASFSPFPVHVNRGLPRYDLRDSSSETDNRRVLNEGKDSNHREDEDIQLITLTTPDADLESSFEISSFDTEEAQPETVVSAEEVLLYEKGSQKPRHGWIFRRKPLLSAADVEIYAASRVMTPLQERWNAYTMIPYPILCLYYIFSHAWIPISMVKNMQQELQGLSSAWPEEWIGNPSECWKPSWSFLSLPYTPPLPVLAVLIGCTCHAPWSMLYHWKCQVLAPGWARLNHWSRRMDQAMLHFMCAMWAYATSGSFDYLIAVSLFNAESAYRQFMPKVNPRRNKVRLMLGTIAYSVPLLRLGHRDLFLYFWFTTSISIWFFAAYPIGGWSHSAFHIMGLLNVIPLLVGGALTPVAQHAVTMGAQCTAWQARAA